MKRKMKKINRRTLTVYCTLTRMVYHTLHQPTVQLQTLCKILTISQVKNIKEIIQVQKCLLTWHKDQVTKSQRTKRLRSLTPPRKLTQLPIFRNSKNASSNLSLYIPYGHWSWWLPIVQDTFMILIPPSLLFVPSDRATTTFCLGDSVNFLITVD